MPFPLVSAALEAIVGACKVYEKSVELQEKQFDRQAGIDAADLVHLREENKQLKARLAVYEAVNAKPGSGPGSSDKL